MPPPLPRVAYTGIPAELNISISLYMVLADTSKYSANYRAVILPFSSNR